MYIQSAVLYLLNSKFYKRDAIREIEKECQERWERERIFEADAPKVCIINRIKQQPIFYNCFCYNNRSKKMVLLKSESRYIIF